MAAMAQTETAEVLGPGGAVPTGAEGLRPEAGQPPSGWSRALLRVWGPGLIVMLADTDAGCLITAAQSGTEFGFAMVLPQLLLIPVLYVVQEITVRLGVFTGKGHGSLIREHFGMRWGALSAGTLALSAIGALLTEFAGVAGVGELFGVSKFVTVPVATVALIVVALLGSYRRAEKIGIAVGVFELLFIPAMLLAHPHAADLLHGLRRLPLRNHAYMQLLAANVGAVVMPWMVFYQQSAVVAKRLGHGDLRAERRDTLVGSVLTQGVMIVVVVALAATAFVHDPGASLQTVGDIVGALSPSIGGDSARLYVGGAVLGGALVAALVVSLAGSWGLAEVLGWRHSLDERISRENAKFFGTYSAVHVLGAVLVLASVDLVSLAIDVEVMNALLLPIVLGFLLVLERRALPAQHRMRGGYRFVVTALCVAVIGFGFYMVPVTLG